jgi:AcrR family transcriptional regulator
MPTSTSGAERTRRRVLQATEAALWQMGPSRVALNDIATLAGISRQTIYRYFSSKEELLDAVAAEAAAEFESGLARASSTGSPTERLDAALTYVAEYQSQMNRSILQFDSAFALERIERSLPALRASVAKLLRQNAANRSARRGRTVDRVADLVVRTAISHFLFPAARGSDLLYELRLVAGLVSTADGRDRR